MPDVKHFSTGVIDFVMFRLREFWRETLLFLNVIWPRSNQWEIAQLGNKQILTLGTSERRTCLGIHCSKWDSAHKKWCLNSGNKFKRKQQKLMSSTFFIRVLFFCFFSLTMLHARLKGWLFCSNKPIEFRRSRCRRSFVRFPLAPTKLASFRF